MRPILYARIDVACEVCASECWVLRWAWAPTKNLLNLSRVGRFGCIEFCGSAQGLLATCTRVHISVGLWRAGYPLISPWHGNSQVHTWGSLVRHPLTRDACNSLQTQCCTITNRSDIQTSSGRCDGYFYRNSTSVYGRECMFWGLSSADYVTGQVVDWVWGLALSWYHVCLSELGAWPLGWIQWIQRVTRCRTMLNRSLPLFYVICSVCAPTSAGIIRQVTQRNLDVGDRV